MFVDLFIEYFVPVSSLIVAAISCVYTYKSYRNRRKASVENMRNRRNRRELERLFSVIPLDAIESFLSMPNIMRDELRTGLLSVDLKLFQYDGKGRDVIIKLINQLENFLSLLYEETPSHHWKYRPIPEDEEYDKIVENQRIDDLHRKARNLKPLLQLVKNLLMQYQVDLKNITAVAYKNYHCRKKKLD